jgi:hypothetical protein
VRGPSRRRSRRPCSIVAVLPEEVEPLDSLPDPPVAVGLLFADRVNAANALLAGSTSSDSVGLLLSTLTPLCSMTSDKRSFLSR